MPLTDLKSDQYQANYRSWTDLDFEAIYRLFRIWEGLNKYYIEIVNRKTRLTNKKSVNRITRLKNET